MSAAAARPPVLHQLLASRPERDRDALGATAASLVLHAALIATLLALTARVRSPEPTVDAPVILLTPTVYKLSEPVQTGNGGSDRAPVAGPNPPAVTWPNIPSPTIPRPGQPIQEFGVPTTLVAPMSAGKGSQSMPLDGGPQSFIPLTVPPKLLNAAELVRTMQRLYPGALLNAGIGGTTTLWLRLDEDGRVIEKRIKQSSGRPALDEAALEVGGHARFSPAYNRDQRVLVWVELPVVFVARD